MLGFNPELERVINKVNDETVHLITWEGVMTEEIKLQWEALRMCKTPIVIAVVGDVEPPPQEMRDYPLTLNVIKTDRPVEVLAKEMVKC